MKVPLKNIIRVDAFAGLSVGIATLFLHKWLAGLFNLPSQTVLTLAVITVVYGTYSGMLAVTRLYRKRILIKVLIIGNVAYGIGVQLVPCFIYPDVINFAGVAYYVLESLFMISLAYAEGKAWTESVRTINR